MLASDIRAAVEAADQRIRPHVMQTPLRRSDYLSRTTGAEVLCKLENIQVTGSFKARGAANKIAALTDDERARGIVTASSGNHGAAVAAMLAQTSTKGIVFVPTVAPQVKVDAIRGYGAEVRFHSSDSGVTELFARAHAGANSLTFISPYNDPAVIAGQGTIGAELGRQTGPIDHLFVSVGGGGLISGVAGYLKAVQPGVNVVGVSPAHDCSMHKSAAAGKVVEDHDAQLTLSDGTAGSVEPGAITLPLCRELVDDWLLVSEDEIAGAMRLFMAHDNQLIEGAAGVAIAGLLQAVAKAPGAFAGKRVVVIICGGRIDLAKLKKLLPG